MPRGGLLSVLVVDDSPFFASMLAGRLQSSYDIGTTTATDAEEAMKSLDEVAVDCVVSDYEMPGTSGLELYERVEAAYDIPFILLTAEGDEEIASRAIGMGVDEYLLKQAVSEDDSLELLVNRIENVVEQRRTQQKYERLVDNSPDEIAEVSLGGEILAANETMATSFGVDRSDLQGEHLSAFLPDDVAENRLRQGRRAITAGSSVTFQDSIGVRHFHNIAVPLPAPGADDSIQFVSREITIQKRTERKLEQKSEKLTLINRILRHDVRNDVQTLILWADQLRDHVDEAGAPIVDHFEDTSYHIAELTSIAKDFVESIESDTDLDRRPVAIDRIVQTEAEKKRASYADATITVDSVPEVDVRANELLSSVFANLLSNAIRHNDQENPEIHVEGELAGENVVVAVADDGPGVADEHKEAIFGKDEMGPESPGTGVGLYLVHTLVDQFGGRVWVEDNEPRGARFVVELPVHPE